MSGKSPTKLAVTSRHDQSCLLGRKATNQTNVLLTCLQHHVTDLEARLALKDAEAADLRQRLARNGTVVSDVNGGYYLAKTEPQHLFLYTTQYFLHTSKSVLNNNPF